MIHESFNKYTISQLLTHSCLWIISKGNVSLQIGLQKNCLSNSKPSNSLIFILLVELAGHSLKHFFLNSYL